MSIRQDSDLREASDRAIKLQDESPSPQEMAEWLEWSQSQPEKLEAFERVNSLLMDMKGLDAARKEAALRRLIPNRTAAPPKNSFVRYAWAASLAMVLLTAAVWWRWHQDSNSLLNDSYATVKAQSRQLKLPDGTRVDLGASTQARVLYSASERVVELTEGEAFFEVARDAARPFAVRVGDWRLNDIGTSFNVRKTRSNMVVTVAEGIVDVMSPEDPSPPLRLRAGEQAALAQQGKVVRVARVDARTVSSWKQGQLRFNDEPLAAVLANLNRYASREIVIADPSIADMRFSGTVLVDNIDGWLAATCRVFALRQEGGDGSHVLLYRD